ncbi:CRISPR-associated protein Csx19 [Aerococcaceae bacterium NML130460]|nr:CRISPR-associated protein Csx19 [Aerococcaceae bacterium NML130460]
MCEINEFRSMHSTVERLSLNADKLCPKKIIDCIKNCEYAILYYMDKVEIKRVEKIQSENIGIENLLELRAFNEMQEVYLVRVEEQFIGRTREDSEGQNTKIFDEYHRLWGKVPKEETNTLKEDRGIELHLPFIVAKDEYVFIKVRNYFTAEGDLSCVDWRFTGFECFGEGYDIKESSYPAEYLKRQEEK